MSSGFICHPDYFEHDTGPVHPETAGRLRAILQQLSGHGLLSELEQIRAPAATSAQVEAVHQREYIDRLERACRDGERQIDCADSTISSLSYQVALLAAGGAVAAVDGVVAKKFKNAFCALRPPGHHAEADCSMGFCLFNNIAVAARHAQSVHAIERVWILDWDVHHGNGTQHSFERDPSILYVSFHQHPDTLYPGTGHQEETGKGPGEGFTLNLPMPPYSTDEDYLALFDRTVAPRVDEFKPDLVLISAGFDAHQADPLANINLSEAGFERLTRKTLAIADEHADGRVVSILEGGYDLDTLANCVETHLRVLMQA